MITFSVTVQTANRRFKYVAIGATNFAVLESAQERFGALSSITVIPRKEIRHGLQS